MDPTRKHRPGIQGPCNHWELRSSPACQGSLTSPRTAAERAAPANLAATRPPMTGSLSRTHSSACSAPVLAEPTDDWHRPLAPPGTGTWQPSQRPLLTRLAHDCRRFSRACHGFSRPPPPRPFLLGCVRCLLCGLLACFLPVGLLSCLLPRLLTASTTDGCNDLRRQNRETTHPSVRPFVLRPPVQRNTVRAVLYRPSSPVPFLISGVPSTHPPEPCGTLFFSFPPQVRQRPSLPRPRLRCEPPPPKRAHICQPNVIVPPPRTPEP